MLVNVKWCVLILLLLIDNWISKMFVLYEINNESLLDFVF